MWSEGVIGIPDAKDKDKYTECHYAANYDRGWDVEPTCKEAEMAYSILMVDYN